MTQKEIAMNIAESPILARLHLSPDALSGLSESGQQVLSAAVAVMERLTDDDMTIFRRLFEAEASRREQLSVIPGQIAELSEAYERAGGDRANLPA